MVWYDEFCAALNCKFTHWLMWCQSICMNIVNIHTHITLSFNRQPECIIVTRWINAFSLWQPNQAKSVTDSLFYPQMSSANENLYETCFSFIQTRTKSVIVCQLLPKSVIFETIVSRSRHLISGRLSVSLTKMTAVVSRFYQLDNYSNVRSMTYSVLQEADLYF